MSNFSNTLEEQPLVSVVIPCYNHDQFVQESIQSVIDQDYKNIELIIIDDGSQDRSVEKIEEMIKSCEQRFTRFEFRSRPNKGLCTTLNEAIVWAEGELFAPLASDDILKVNKTSLQVAYLNDFPDVLGVFAGIELLAGVQVKHEITRPCRLNESKKYDFNDIFLHNHFLPAPTQMLRLDAVKKIGGYKDDFIVEDWLMWLLLTEAGGKLGYISEKLAFYRRHDGNLSGDVKKMHLGRLQIVELFKNKKKYKLAMSKILMIHANEIYCCSKKKSTKYFGQAIIKEPKIILSKSFIAYILKFLTFK